MKQTQGAESTRDPGRRQSVLERVNTLSPEEIDEEIRILLEAKQQSTRTRVEKIGVIADKEAEQRDDAPRKGSEHEANAQMKDRDEAAQIRETLRRAPSNEPPPSRAEHQLRHTNLQYQRTDHEDEPPEMVIERAADWISNKYGKVWSAAVKAKDWVLNHPKSSVGIGAAAAYLQPAPLLALMKAVPALALANPLGVSLAAGGGLLYYLAKRGRIPGPAKYAGIAAAAVGGVMTLPTVVITGGAALAFPALLRSIAHGIRFVRGGEEAGHPAAPAADRSRGGGAALAASLRRRHGV